MSRRTRRTALALTAAASSVALAAPAFGAGVDVTLVGVGGTRQFSVEDVTGAPLTALDLGLGNATPFRTHVADSSYLPALTSTGNYTVDATLTNLYLKDTVGNYVYSTKIASSAAQIGFPAGALVSKGLSLSAIPRLSVAGTLSSCASLSTPLKGFLGLNLSGLPILGNTALADLCTELGTAGAPIAAVVDGAIASLTPTITDVLALPTALTTTGGGTFTNPSFAAGTAGFNDPAKTGTAATPVRLMTGTRALSSTIVDLLDTAFTTALSGKPLTSVTPAAGQLPVASIIGVLTGAGSSAVEVALGNALSTLSSADQVGFLNTVLSATRQVPVLGDLLGVTGDAFAFPVLSAAPTTSVAGTYGGTMTVTFVQT